MSWTGARATADSMEVIGGVATPRRTAFRAYGSIEESINDFANLLQKLAAVQRRQSPAGGNAAVPTSPRIGKSGYATDPEYGNKLNQILGSGALQSALATRVAKL